MGDQWNGGISGGQSLGLHGRSHRYAVALAGPLTHQRSFKSLSCPKYGLAVFRVLEPGRQAGYHRGVGHDATSSQFGTDELLEVDQVPKIERPQGVAGARSLQPQRQTEAAVHQRVGHGDRMDSEDHSRASTATVAGQNKSSTSRCGRGATTAAQPSAAPPAASPRNDDHRTGPPLRQPAQAPATRTASPMNLPADKPAATTHHGRRSPPPPLIVPPSRDLRRNTASGTPHNELVRERPEPPATIHKLSPDHRASLCTQRPTNGRCAHPITRRWSPGPRQKIAPDLGALSRSGATAGGIRMGHSFLID
jgi:hypothetical protein